MLTMFMFVVSLISILVVATGWYVATSNPKALEKKCSGTGTLAFTVQLSNRNWTLLSTCTNKDIHLDDVTVTIRYPNGTIANTWVLSPLTTLIQGGWTTYHARYITVDGEDYVRQGAQLILDSISFPAGCTCQLMDWPTVYYQIVLH